MLQNILNLEGVTILDKKQKEAVSGGFSCVFTYISNNGHRERERVGVPIIASGDQQESFAQSRCSNAIGKGWSRCFYDCSHDGIADHLSNV